MSKNNYIESPVESLLGNPEDLSGTGSSTHGLNIPPDVPPPATGFPFKGLESVDDSTKGLTIEGPEVNKA